MSRSNLEYAHFYRALDHLVRLASTPGWKEYAWARAKEMDAHQTGMWAGIAQALAAEMQAINGAANDSLSRDTDNTSQITANNGREKLLHFIR